MHFKIASDHFKTQRMNTSNVTPDLTNQVIQQAVSLWASRNAAVTGFFNKYNDTAYLNEIAPGRNRAVYLLGHLIASNDNMLPLFGFGPRLFPELEAIFNSPDRTVENIPSLAELKQKWETLNTALTAHFNALTAQGWLGRHTAVSEEDFAKEPHRNKLNVLLSRTNHQSYHLGQLNLLPVQELVAH